MANNYEEALKELTKASEFPEATSMVYFILGKTYKALGMKEEYAQAMEKADQLMAKEEDL